MNFDPAVLEKILTDPDPEADPATIEDVSAIAESFAKTQEKLLIAKKDLFTKADFDREFTTHRQKLASDVNKTLNMGLTRSQIAELKWEDFVNQAGSFVSEAVTKATKITDNELKDQLHEYKSSVATLSEKLAQVEDTVEARVAERTAQLEKERNAEIVERLFQEKFANKQWVPKHAPIQKAFIKNKVLETYEIHPDAQLTQNGGKEAINFTNTGHYKTLDEAIDYLYEAHEMNPQHKGGSGGEDKPIIVSAVKLEGGKLGDNAQAMMDRAIKHRTDAGLNV
jgi:hypothetical protein